MIKLAKRLMMGGFSLGSVAWLRITRQWGQTLAGVTTFLPQAGQRILNGAGLGDDLAAMIFTSIKHYQSSG
jgi:hypothetical protein